MRALLAMMAVVVLAIGIGVGITTAVSPIASSQTNTWTISPRQPAIRLLVNDACPKNIAHDHDVTNINSNAHTVLVPQNPNAGLICRYGTPTSDGVPFNLVQTKKIGRTDAAALAAAIDRLSTKRPTSVEFCPAAFATATIIALSYTRWHDADIWYDDTGCQTVDNGFLMAGPVNDEPFSAFALLVDHLAPRP